ncbi:MAG: hypothetical protein BMS9Abin34_393 [Patescibacteria group bacterium]|nr:MAG: hypothetical protein BMS9Abin34_393 [Patescibacteria group bacterium]
MLCLIALIVFSVLGIFSATHRQLAKEAFNCVFRRVTLRPCDTGFDQKIKGKIIGKLLAKSPKLARGAHRFWEPLSWVMVILFFGSLFLSGRSVYNLVKFKTCDPANPQSCILDAPECSPSEHCQPCSCGVAESECQPPEYAPCGGEENCDCDVSCKASPP